MTIALTGKQLAHAALHANGCSIALAAEIMGVTPGTVATVRKTIRRKYEAEGVDVSNSVLLLRSLERSPPGIKPPRAEPRPRISRVRQGRPGRPYAMTPEQVASAKRMRDEGCRPEEIATRFEVSMGTVFRALRRAT